VALQPNVVHGLLKHEVSRSHTTTHQSVGLLWTRDERVAKTSTWQHEHSQQKDIHAPVGFEPRISAGERP